MEDFRSLDAVMDGLSLSLSRSIGQQRAALDENDDVEVPSRTVLLNTSSARATSQQHVRSFAAVASSPSSMRHDGGSTVTVAQLMSSSSGGRYVNTRGGDEREDQVFSTHRVRTADEVMNELLLKQLQETNATVHQLREEKMMLSQSQQEFMQRNALGPGTRSNVMWERQRQDHEYRSGGRKERSAYESIHAPGLLQQEQSVQSANASTLSSSSSSLAGTFNHSSINYSAEVEVLTAKLRSQRSAMETALAAKDAVEDSLRVVQAELGTAKAEVEKWTQLHHGEKQKTQVLERQWRQLQEELVEQVRARTDMQQRIAYLVDTNERLTKAHEDLTVSSGTAADRASLEHAQLKEQLARKEEELALASRWAQRYEEVADELEQMQTAARDASADLEHVRTEAEAEAKSWRRERGEYQNVVSTLETVLKDHTFKYETLMKKYATGKKRFADGVQAQLEQAQRSRELKAELARLQEQVQVLQVVQAEAAQQEETHHRLLVEHGAVSHEVFQSLQLVRAAAQMHPTQQQQQQQQQHRPGSPHSFTSPSAFVLRMHGQLLASPTSSSAAASSPALLSTVSAANPPSESSFSFLSLSPSVSSSSSSSSQWGAFVFSPGELLSAVHTAIHRLRSLETEAVAHRERDTAREKEFAQTLSEKVTEWAAATQTVQMRHQDGELQQQELLRACGEMQAEVEALQKEVAERDGHVLDLHRMNDALQKEYRAEVAVLHRELEDAHRYLDDENVNGMTTSGKSPGKSPYRRNANGTGSGIGATTPIPRNGEQLLRRKEKEGDDTDGEGDEVGHIHYHRRGASSAGDFYGSPESVSIATSPFSFSPDASRLHAHAPGTATAGTRTKTKMTGNKARNGAVPDTAPSKISGNAPSDPTSPLSPSLHDQQPQTTTQGEGGKRRAPLLQRLRRRLTELQQKDVKQQEKIAGLLQMLQEATQVAQGVEVLRTQLMAVGQERQNEEAARQVLVHQLKESEMGARQTAHVLQTLRDDSAAWQRKAEDLKDQLSTATASAHANAVESSRLLMKLVTVEAALKGDKRRAQLEARHREDEQRHREDEQRQVLLEGKLELDRRELNDKVQQAQAETSQTLAESARWQTLCAQTETLLRAAEMRRQQVEQQLTSVAGTTSQLEWDLQTVREQCARCQASLVDQNETVAALMHQQKDADYQLTACRQSLEARNLEMEHVKGVLSQLERERIGDRDTVVRLQAENGELARQRSVLEQDRHEWKRLSAEAVIQQTRLENAEDMAAQRQKQIVDLKKLLHGCEQDVVVWKVKNLELEQRLAGLEEAHAKKREVIMQQVGTAEDKEEEVRRRIQEDAAHIAKEQELSTQLWRSVDRVSALEAEVARLSLLNDKLKDKAQTISEQSTAMSRAGSGSISREEYLMSLQEFEAALGGTELELVQAYRESDRRSRHLLAVLQHLSVLCVLVRDHWVTLDSVGLASLLGKAAAALDFCEPPDADDESRPDRNFEAVGLLEDDVDEVLDLRMRLAQRLGEVAAAVTDVKLARQWVCKRLASLDQPGTDRTQP